MDTTAWKGIHVILVTPFKEDLDVDLDAYRRVVRHAASAGGHVLVALGTQGEFHSLSVEERKQIAAITVEESGAKRVIVGTSHVNTREAVELSKHAREVGADAVMLTPPYFAAVTADSVRSHIQQVTDEADIDVFLYNAPERAGFNWTPALLSSLVDTNPRIAGVKQASPNVHELAETVALCQDKFAIIGGSEAMIYQTLALGMIGCTSTTATVFAEPFVRIYELIEEGRYGEACDVFMGLAPLRRSFTAAGHAAGVKVALEAAGLSGSAIRPPLPPASPEARGAVLEALQALGFEATQVRNG